MEKSTVGKHLIIYARTGMNLVRERQGAIPVMAKERFSPLMPTSGFRTLLWGAFGHDGAQEVLVRCASEENYHHAAHKLRESISLAEQEPVTEADLPDMRITRMAESGLTAIELAGAIHLGKR